MYILEKKLVTGEGYTLKCAASEDGEHANVTAFGDGDRVGLFVYQSNADSRLTSCCQPTAAVARRTERPTGGYVSTFGSLSPNFFAPH